MSLHSSLKHTLLKILPTLKALVLSNPIKEKATTLLLKWIETLLKKALQFGFNANTLPQQPVMAAL